MLYVLISWDPLLRLESPKTAKFMQIQFDFFVLPPSSVGDLPRAKKILEIQGNREIRKSGSVRIPHRNLNPSEHPHTMLDHILEHPLEAAVSKSC